MAVTITARGQTLTVTEWSHVTGLAKATLFNRKARGWPDHLILDTPPGQIPEGFDRPQCARRSRYENSAPPPFMGDPVAWLDQVWRDSRARGRSFEAAYGIYLALLAGEWPLSITELGRRAHMDRRTVQRVLDALQHCGHLRLSYASPSVTHVILIDKSAPAEPALMAAE